MLGKVPQGVDGGPMRPDLIRPFVRHVEMALSMSHHQRRLV
jgi:hypothetical protein